MNYQQTLDRELEQIAASGRVPRLLLHCCCAPCSSYVLEYLSRYFSITAYYYNPNIAPAEEYDHRAAELVRLAAEMPLVHPVAVRRAAYDPAAFAAVAKGHEADPEGGERCMACFRLRLSASAAVAKAEQFDYFTTTLSISPLKNAQALNAIGRELSEEYGVPYLYSDFKKRDGYKRSCQLSEIYGLYRQDYCGCAFSKRESEARRSAQT